MALEPYAPNPKQTSLDVPPPRHGFTMQDFRLFNHFKSDSHPFHPFGNEEIWTHEVPSISHKVGFPISQNSGMFKFIKMDITKFAFEFLNKAVPKLINVSTTSSFTPCSPSLPQTSPVNPMNQHSGLPRRSPSPPATVSKQPQTKEA